MRGGDGCLGLGCCCGRRVAVLVRGNWVRKSSLYGLPPRLTDARDAMLITLER